MTRKKTDKKIPCLEPQFHNVLVCKKTNCRPFLEILVEEPENVSRQNLGILAGIFQIDDRSEDSSYVVNYLISIIKKEYFSRANRGPVENFESALHKANLALAKLATHENIGWIGKINAICAVIEKNNLLVSQTGNASVFLLRGTTLMEITELPNESIDSNPLKTFQDVISGKIEKNDKLLFVTKEIFDIFSLEELKKSALKFSRENFLQFLNTALINELEQVAALIVDIDEKIDAPMEAPTARKIEELNVFSQTAFRKDSTPKALEKAKAKEELASNKRTDLIREIQAERKDFVDQKTGHIYIKEPGDDVFENLPEKTTIDFSASLEKLTELASVSSKFFSKAGYGAKETAAFLWKKSHEKITEFRSRKKATSLDALEQKMEGQLKLEREIEALTRNAKLNLEATPGKEKVIQELTAVAETRTTLKEKIIIVYSRWEIKPKTIALLRATNIGADWLKEKTADGLVLLLRKPTRLILHWTAISKNKWQARKAKNSPGLPLPITIEKDSTTPVRVSVADTTKPYTSEASPKTQNISPGSIETNDKRYPWEIAPTNPLRKETGTKKIEVAPGLKIISFHFSRASKIWHSLNLKKILPDFSRLKQIVRNLDQKQKISALIVLLLLLFVPYLIVQWENKPKEEPVVATEAPAVVAPLEKDLNVIRVEKLDEVYLGDVAKIINLNGKFFIHNNTSIIDLESNKTFSIPQEFQNPDLFVSMNDLGLLFLIKNNQVISFAPITDKFIDTALAFPEGGKIIDAKTYLTYIYLLDTANNQIYRVPRSPGGFGEKNPWLRETINLDDAKEMAINDNIFVLDGNEIIKLFKYKKQSFAIENTTTSIVPNKLYTEQNLTNLYVLDKTNSRIIKLDNDGKILAQYYNAGIADANDFSVNEENDLIYISDESGVKSFNINQ